MIGTFGYRLWTSIPRHTVCSRGMAVHEAEMHLFGLSRMPRRVLAVAPITRLLSHTDQSLPLAKGMVELWVCCAPCLNSRSHGVAAFPSSRYD